MQHVVPGNISRTVHQSFKDISQVGLMENSNVMDQGEVEFEEDGYLGNG